MTTPTLSVVQDYPSLTGGSDPFELAKMKHDAQAQASLVAWVSKEYIRCRNARFRIEQQWYLNLAFYLGKQNVVTQIMNSALIGQVGRLTTPNVPPWRARPVFNKVRRYLRKEHSKICAQKPSAYVVPATSDDKDLMAAQAAEQIWDSIYAVKDVDKQMRMAVWWEVWCGSGFIKEFWNEGLIDSVSNLQGDIDIEAISPFHILVPDLQEQEIEKQQYVMHISTKNVDWVKMHYPKTLSGKEVKPNVNAANAIIDTAFINLISANNLQVNMVLIVEVWIKPGAHKLFPNGGVLTIAGDQIVEIYDGWPYEHGEYPFTKIDHINNATFYSSSSLVDLIPLQREYNRTHGQIIEAKNRMAKPRLIVQKGAIDPKKVSSEPGQIIEYKMGFQKPENLPMDQLPTYVLQELTLIQQDMDDIVGQHDVSSGQVPPGVTAATAIAYLQEEDDTIIHDSIASMEKGYQKIGRHALALAAQFWDVPRLVKTTGTDGSFDVQEFNKDNLAGATDLRVETGSGFPTSKAGKTAMIMDLMKMNFIDPQTGLELLEIGGAPKLYEEIQVDRRQAQRENVKMQGMDTDALQDFASTEAAGGMPDQDGNLIGAPLPVSVNTWDDHATHIDTHNKFRKSQQFEMLDDTAKQLFESHVQMHQSALQMTMPQMPPGEPSMPGEAGPPPEDNGPQQPTLPGMEQPPNG